jgi:predicted nucleic acid-binding protein
VILYLDTSALVKRYVEEDGSERVDSLWEEAAEVVTSTVAFAEGMSAFCRKWREGVISETDCFQTIAEFKSEYLRFALVPITPESNRIVEGLLLKYPLRGFDAIHLASALLIRREADFDVTFACFDAALSGAAKGEGLIVPF